MEFGFDLKPLFPHPIIRIQPHHLRPASPGCKLSRILDTMGRLSAWAQDLRHPVTAASKLAGDQVVFLIADTDCGRLAVTGLLKVGTKDLFLHDEKGAIRRCDRTPAILDFYVHETRQRRGQGKRLFDRMLADQGWRACRCSVDRPSHLMKAFLGKHYGLVRTIPQANNFVLYEGFFDDQIPLLSGRCRGIFTGGEGGGGEPRQRRTGGTSQTQLAQQQHKEPGHKHGHGHGRGQKLQVLPSVADILGVGERINNRPFSKVYHTKISQ